MKHRSKKTARLSQAARYVLMFLIMLLLGFQIGHFFSRMPEDSWLGQDLVFFSAFLLFFYLAFFLQVLLHEGGHFLFGLWTGYRFSSFRIGSLMWVREGDSIRLKRLSVAGTAGQCLMVPPPLENGRMPFVLYNLGGCIVNLAAGLLSYGLYAFFLNRSPAAALFFSLLAFLGILMALLNGLPIRIGGMDNDGCNTLSLCRDPAALSALWIQLMVNDQLSRGVRLKEMPNEWFPLAKDSDLQNALLSWTVCASCNRLMDQHRFAEANEQMAYFLSLENSAMLQLHQRLLVCDRIYCELLEKNQPEVLDSLLSKEQKKFFKSMRIFPSVLRTQYAHALLVERDASAAARFEHLFQKAARSYPYPGDLALEEELFQLAQKKAAALPPKGAI